MDLEIFLSASPPLFKHDGFNSLSTFRNQHKLNGFTNVYTYPNHSKMPPIRSCLLMREDDVTLESKDEVKGKKRVWFADDKGLALTHVRFMTEPSDCPPKWSEEFLECITRGARPQVNVEYKWEPSFTQPASDYIEFRNKLELNCVSLENVIIKDDDQFTGTVKVKNLSFEKEVFIRITFDRWLSYQDAPAMFVPHGMECSSSYDTFSFSAAIPSSAAKFEVIEFCVCFKNQTSEFWDNNGGSNYKLVLSKMKPQESLDLQKFVDAFKAEFDSWTDFASWNHLVTEGPYW
ncbi:protein phosphatase 1 regulatory subunit 3C-B-like [Limulus polyphemus]|uniref:Protein phosphatase 1 regulatory subunit 3C-B-like n=1 Tax=Limulus polyphemus TaxID=6850 RepID=A0ABM1T6V5_LIMPO|nr:protein phosphatase 1 regulatory subunit 3C-B-like [Limulus polyphemus]